MSGIFRWGDWLTEALTLTEAFQGAHLVALDVDGTLMHDSGSICAEVKDAVALAVAAGHLATIASGRSLGAVLPVRAEPGLNCGHAVSSDGGYLSTSPFQDPSFGTEARRVEFAGILDLEAVRVVASSAHTLPGIHRRGGRRRAAGRGALHRAGRLAGPCRNWCGRGTRKGAPARPGRHGRAQREQSERPGEAAGASRRSCTACPDVRRSPR